MSLFSSQHITNSECSSSDFWSQTKGVTSSTKLQTFTSYRKENRTFGHGLNNVSQRTDLWGTSWIKSIQDLNSLFFSLFTNS